MSVGQLGWILFLAGLPFAHLLWHQGLDIWMTQTTWAQASLVGLLAWSGGSSLRLPQNRPLMLSLAWAGGSSLWIWTAIAQRMQQFPLSLLMPLMHVVFAWLFYLLAVSTWTPPLRAAVWRAMAWAGVFVVAYGYLQVAHLDQFYLNIDRKLRDADLLVGTIGNPTHFGSYLALVLPCFLLRPGWGWRIMVVVLTILLCLTKSVAALVAWWVVMTVWCAWRVPHIAGPILAGSLGLALLLGSGLWWRFPGFFNPEGRLLVWQAFWSTIVQKPITGWGPGAVMEASKTITSGPLWKWRHLHCEPLQVWQEYGAIGVSLLGWMLAQWSQWVWRLPKTPELGMFVAIGMAFGALSLVSFPGHLWLLGSFGLIAYCGVYRLVQEQESTCP